MNKKLLIILTAAVVVLGGGAAAYFLTRDNDNSANKSTDANSTSDQLSGESSGDTPVFNPLATENTSFVATMTGASEGVNYTTVIESDGKGNTKYSGSTNGTTYEMYLIDGAYITCSAGQCFKTNVPDTSAVDEDQYNYTAEDFENFKNTSLYKGKQACPAGSCDTWEVSYGGYTSTLFIDSSNRINKLTSNTGGTSFEITYEYRDVTITPPANVQTLPGSN